MRTLPGVRRRGLAFQFLLAVMLEGFVVVGGLALSWWGGAQIEVRVVNSLPAGDGRR